VRVPRNEQGIKSPEAGSAQAKIGRWSVPTRAGARQTARKKPDDLLTIAEAAELLNVHVNTVRRWSNKGVLKTYRLGSRGDRRLKRGDINKLLRKGKPARAGR